MSSKAEINRLKRFHRILRIYSQEIPLDVLSQFLYFDDSIKLQQWLINLNFTNFSINLNSKGLQITKELIDELDHYINEIDVQKEDDKNESISKEVQNTNTTMIHVPPTIVSTSADESKSEPSLTIEKKIIRTISEYVTDNQNKEIQLNHLAEKLHIGPALLQVILEDMILSRDVLANIEGRDSLTSDECLLVLDSEWNGEELNKKKEIIIKNVEGLVEKDDLSGAIIALRMLFTIPVLKSKERSQWNEYLIQFEQKLADPSYQMLEDSQLLPREFQTIQDLEKLLGEPLPRLRRLDWNSFGYLVEGHYIVGLGLSNKKLQSLPDSIENLNYLEEFYLRWNQFKTIPACIFKLFRLKKIFLEGNQLTELSSLVGELPELQELNLRHNQINEVPKTIGKLARLTFLSLHSNRIETIPLTIGNLRNLEKLYLGSNRLTNLPKTLKYLRKLHCIDLRDNNGLEEKNVLIGGFENTVENFMAVQDFLIKL